MVANYTHIIHSLMANYKHIITHNIRTYIFQQSSVHTSPVHLTILLYRKAINNNQPYGHWSIHIHTVSKI